MNAGHQRPGRWYDVACAGVVLLAGAMIAAGWMLLTVADHAERRQFQAFAEAQAAQLARGVDWQIGDSLRDTAVSPTLLLQQAEIEPAALAALVAADGTVAAWRRPGVTQAPRNIAGTALFRAMRGAPQGAWTGPSPGDGVARVHAFRVVPDRGLAIVVGLDAAHALRPARSWQRTAYQVAVIRSACVGLGAAVACWILRLARRHAGDLARERNRLAAAHAEAEARAAQLHAVLTGMSDGVMLLDARHRLVLWNARFAAYAGVPPTLLREGVPLAQLLRAQAEAGAFGPLDGAAAIEAAVTAELRDVDSVRDGGSGAIAHPQHDDGGVEFRRSRLPDGGLVTVYTDVTERRRRESAQAEAQRLVAEAAEQKARFAAFVSHEIRTPLSALLGSLGLLGRAALSPPQHALVAAAREAGTGLLALVQDVLELSRLDAPQPAVCSAAFAWRPLLASVMAAFSREAEARGIELRVAIAPGLPDLLHADPGRVRQVLSNLLVNAVTFSPPGPVLLSAAASGAPACLRLAISDAGPPIPHSEAALLFRPFSRLASARTAATPGTGLGLAISARLVALMGGRIGVGSGPAGNTFWLTLPLASPQSEPAPSPPDRSEATAVDPARLVELQHLLPSEVVAALLQGCLAEARARLPLLQAAIGEADAEAVRRAAHALAGLAAGYGFAALERRARLIEAAAGSGDLAVAVAGADCLQDDLDRAWRATTALLAETPRAA